jgi:hypothetical protein
VDVAARMGLSLRIRLFKVYNAFKFIQPSIHLLHGISKFFGFVLRNLGQSFVLLETYALLLLLLVKFFVVFFNSEKFGLDLYHLFLIEVKKLHVAHLFLITDGFLGFIQA